MEDADALVKQAAKRIAYPDECFPSGTLAFDALVVARAYLALLSSRPSIIEECAKVAERTIEDIAGDLWAIFETYCEAQSTGRHAGRPIKADLAKMFARNFKERSLALSDTTKHVTDAIRSLKEEKDGQ